MILKPLDVILYTGHKPVSLWVRLCTTVRYGIPFKACRSHVDIRYNDKLNISAELSGTKLVEFEKALKHCDITVYRFRQLPPLECFYDVANKLLGRLYAYARYALDAARIFSFCFAVTGLLLSLFTLRVKIGMFAAVGLLQALTVWLRKLDIQSDDCSEVVSVILSEIGLMSHLPKARNEFPNSIELKMQLLCRYGLADKVGTWDHKKQKWVD